MTDIITLVTQPLMILIAALLLLVARTIFHARRLRTTAKEPELAKILAAGVANPLSVHKESLDSARGEKLRSLDSAKKTLRNYSRAYRKSKPKKT